MIIYILSTEYEFELNTIIDIDELNLKLKNISDIKIEESFYYEGSDENINDLFNILNRLFKKFIISENKFDKVGYYDIVEFIENELDNFSLSKRINLKNYPKLINFRYFLGLQYVNHFEIQIVDNIDKINIKNINRSESILLKFDTSEDCHSLFLSMKYDIQYKEIDENNLYISSMIEEVKKLIKMKINILSNFKNIKIINSEINNVINFGDTSTYLNSNEVCNILNISKQTLSNWRRSRRIEYEKISDRIFRYKLSHIKNILDKEIIIDTLSSQNNPNIKIKKNTNSNNHEEIKKWMKRFTYRINPQKFKNQKFFLNFGNININSSPQVMISNDFKLVDYIKKQTIIESADELLNYLNELDSIDKEPKIDNSKIFYQNFDHLYLNNLN